MVLAVGIFIVGVVRIYGIFSVNSGEKVEIKEAVQEEESNEVKEEEKKEEEILVHLGGAVENPGVYRCQQGVRLYEVLDKAGGPTSEAELNSVNLVSSVRDGEQIIIPKSQESNSNFASDSSSNQGKIDLNTASKEQLEELSGVGPALAGRIIDYREQNNFFKGKSELKEVSGIGSKTFEKIEGQITY